MGAFSLLGLLANGLCLLLLYRHRNDDLNMSSVWICTRNDVVGNIAVMAAAAGVFGTSAGWPDLAVGAIMASLALSGAWRVVRQARRELRQPLAALSAGD
jgi:Co/Zn/Cd efflux system component